MVVTISGARSPLPVTECPQSRSDITILVLNVLYHNSRLAGKPVRNAGSACRRNPAAICITGNSFYTATP